jgi:hypothetical protein
LGRWRVKYERPGTGTAEKSMPNNQLTVITRAAEGPGYRQESREQGSGFRPIAVDIHQMAGWLAEEKADVGRRWKILVQASRVGPVIGPPFQKRLLAGLSQG